MIASLHQKQILIDSGERKAPIQINCQIHSIAIVIHTLKE